MYKLAARVAIAVVLIPVARLELGAQNPQQAQQLLARLQSAQSSDEATEKLLRLGSSDPNVKQYLASHLPAILIKGPRDSSQPWMNAVRLAGELKIAEAVPALTKWIGLNTGGPLTLAQEGRLDTNAPAKALVQIGNPAIPALSAVVNHGSLSERWNSAYALNLIRTPQAKAVLRDHVSREPDPSLRQFIQRSINGE